MTAQTDTYIVSALQQLGLNTHEANTYLTCFNRGEVTIMELSRITGIKRTTLYGIVEVLIGKGLIRVIQKGAHRIYSAENPKKFKIMLEKSRENLVRKEAFLSS